MQIPKKVNILGRQYSIIFQDERKTGNDNLGSHWGKETSIFLNKNQDQQAVESCFIHEILEAINYLQNINLKHHQIKLFETGLYQVIKNNKWKREG